MYVAASAEYDTLVTKRAPITARSSALSTENSRETRYTASDTHTSERTPESHGVPAPPLNTVRYAGQRNRPSDIFQSATEPAA